MDLFLIAIILLSSLAVCFFLHNQFSSAKRSDGSPEAGGAWPVIGHLHLLSGSQLLHKVLGGMADKYGPVFRMKLGVNRVLVVSDPKIAKECFTTNDLAFASRPKSILAEIIGYNYAMFAFASYGPYWWEMKKISTIEFISPRRIEMLRHFREFEVKSAITETYNYCVKNLSTSSSATNGAVKMEMKEWFENLIVNTMVKMLFGVRYTSNEEEERTDPNIWPNPHEFKPERFLTIHKEVDVKGNHFELIPLGSGRRMCPGISLALQVVPFVLAVLLHGFDIKRPSSEPIDMTENFGLTILKTSPLEVLLKPRLAPNLYK